MPAPTTTTTTAHDTAEDLSVPLSSLQRLPAPFTIISAKVVRDMAGKNRRALHVSWPSITGHRAGFFAVDSGDYICEAI